MNHCLIITAYKDANMINNIITRAPRNWGIYIHIDQKAQITPKDIDNRAQILKIKNIYWGGREHLDAFILLLKTAYNDSKHYDYYHLMTGQDFYSISPDKFDKILGKDNMNYLEVHACPRVGWWGGGYDILKYRTLSSHLDIRKKIYKVLNITLYYMQKTFKLTRALPDYPLFGGSVYCSLTHDAIHEVLYGKVAFDLLRRFDNTTCGEEIFFQTVIMNSHLKEKVINDNLRYIDWGVKSPPKTLNEEDFENIHSTKALFCRKIDSQLSNKLIQKLFKLVDNN